MGTAILTSTPQTSATTVATAARTHALTICMAVALGATPASLPSVSAPSLVFSISWQLRRFHPEPVIVSGLRVLRLPRKLASAPTNRCVLPFRSALSSRRADLLSNQLHELRSLLQD